MQYSAHYATATNVTRIRGHVQAFPALLDRRYEVHRYITYDNTRAVFLGLDTHSMRHVVIKQLQPRVAQNRRLTEAFLREGARLVALRHPNVVPTLDMGGDDRPYIVMEHHPVQDLECWAMTMGGPPLPLEQAIVLLDQICAGLQALHEAGLVHGDVTPGNIRVTDAQEVLLTDLGLSTGLVAHFEPQRIDGTPGYVAPELFLRGAPRESLAPKLDVYALGVTAYWMLTGRLPWGGEPRDMVTQQIQNRVLPPCTYRHDLCPELDALVMDAIESEPSRRPSAEQFRAVLAHELEWPRSGCARMA